MRNRRLSVQLPGSPVRAALAALLLCLVPASQAAPFDPFAETGIDGAPGAAVPLDLPFRDETGRETTLAQAGEGRVLLLVPVLHECPNICEVTLQGMMQAVQAQRFRPGADFTFVAFGIDAREKPEAAARSLAGLRKAFPALAASGGIHGLTGDERSIRAVTDALGYRFAFNPEIAQVAHLAAGAVLTRDGRLSRWLFGLSPEPTDLRLALAEAGEGRVGGWTEKLLLLCFHYDPVTGRYGNAIWVALRAGGAATALLLAAFVAAALLRERRGAGRAS